MDWLGRLTLYRRGESESTWQRLEGGDLWCGPKLKLDAKAQRQLLVQHTNKLGLPTSLGVLRSLTQLVFVELPHTMDLPMHSSGDISLIMRKPRMPGQPLLPNIGFGLDPTIKGYKLDESKVEPIAATLTWVHRVVKVKAREGPPQSWTYQSRSQFNPERGLVQDTSGTYVFDQGGSKVTTKISVKLLEGEARDRASATVREWRKAMPRELTPK